MELSEEEKRIINLRYILRMLKDECYSREEIITELEHELKHHLQNNGESSLNDIDEILPNIVRCKDCKYCSVCASGYNSYCNLCHNISYVDGFCSEAEPKGK